MNTDPIPKRPTGIGQFIKQKVNEQHISYAEFARLIHCGRTSLYHIFEAQNIDAERLILISRVLRFDFIAEYYHYHSSEFSSLPAPEPAHSIPESCLVLPFRNGRFDLSELPPEVLAALRRQLSPE